MKTRPEEWVRYGDGRGPLVVPELTVDPEERRRAAPRCRHCKDCGKRWIGAWAPMNASIHARRAGHTTATGYGSGLSGPVIVSALDSFFKQMYSAPSVRVGVYGGARPGGIGLRVEGLLP